MTPLSRILSATSAKIENANGFSIAVWFYLVICSGSPLVSHSTYRAKQEDASDLFELIELYQMRDAKEAQGNLGRYGIAALIMAWLQQADDDSNFHFGKMALWERLPSREKSWQDATLTGC